MLRNREQIGCLAVVEQRSSAGRALVGLDGLCPTPLRPSRREG
jgi:hypothetical protein